LGISLRLALAKTVPVRARYECLWNCFQIKSLRYKHHSSHRSKPCRKFSFWDRNPIGWISSRDGLHVKRDQPRGHRDDPYARRARGTGIGSRPGAAPEATRPAGGDLLASAAMTKSERSPHQERLDAMRKRLAAIPADGLFATPSSNLFYLTG